MKIENIWLELQEEGTRSNIAWLTRLASPKKGYPLLVSLDVQNKSRALMLPARDGNIPQVRDWPECNGLSLSVVTINEQAHLTVQLSNYEFSDVFAVLAEDLTPRITCSKTAKEAMGVFFSRLKLWQKFLAAVRNKWTLEKQRGLWGEIHVLRKYLLDTIGFHAALKGWKGLYQAHQDFQFPKGAIEVKTTAAKQPQHIRITSERQLDDTGVGILLLQIIVVDEREVAASSDLPGETLSMLIASVRKKISGDTESLDTFNELLLDAGWLDTEAERYNGRRYSVRKEFTFKIQTGFPRLIEKDMPSGVGDVAYSLSLSSCTNFSMEEKELLKILSEMGPEKDMV